MLIRGQEVKEIRFKKNTISFVGPEGTQIMKTKVMYGIPREDGAITIYASDYTRIPREIFNVNNDSDPMTDYFDNDWTLVTNSHPAYKWVYLGYLRQKAWRSGKESDKKEAAAWRIEKFEDEAYEACARYLEEGSDGESTWS